MTSLFVKPMADLTAADVEAFLREAPPENLFLELKQDLPEKNGGTSQWMRGEGRFEDRSRNDLAAEIVAFANGDGGRSDFRVPRLGAVLCAQRFPAGL